MYRQAEALLQREREKGERDREVVEKEEEEETDLIKTIIWGSEQLDSGDKKKELCALSSSHHNAAGRLFLYFYNQLRPKPFYDNMLHKLGALSKTPKYLLLHRQKNPRIIKLCEKNGIFNFRHSKLVPPQTSILYIWSVLILKVVKRSLYN